MIYETLFRETEILISQSPLLVPMFPSSYKGDIGSVKEFTSYDLVFSSEGLSTYNTSKDIKAMLYVDVYTESGHGGLRAVQIADSLDEVFQFTCLPSGAQFRQSSFTPKGEDASNSSLQRAEYRVPLTFYGAI